MELKPRTIQMEVHTANALQYLGNVYRSSLEVIGELISNGIDGGGRNLFAYIDPTRLMIWDDGNGMVPEMTPDDRQLVQQFRSGGLTDIEILRQRLSIASFHSLEWMAQSVALSEKFIRDDPKAHGMKAVGALAFLSIANRQVVRSKPSVELAQRFYGTDTRIHNQVPTFQLVFPTSDQLRSGNRSCVIEKAKDLTDAWNKLLIRGTLVEVTEFHGKALESLKPMLVVEYLGSAFTEELGAGIKITVIDNITNEARKLSRGGKPLVVQPPSFRYPPIIDEETKTKKEDRFHIAIYFDPNARGEVPQLRRGGKSVPITQLEEFNRYPWNCGQILGTVHFPEYSPRRAMHLWNTAKGMPVESAERTFWVLAVRAYEPRIIEHIEAVHRRAEDKSMRNLGIELAQAALLAMKDMAEVFGNQSILVTAPRDHVPTSGKTTRNGKKVQAGENYWIRIGVINEHSDGVEGVELELWKGGKRVDLLRTGLSGHVLFRELTEGRYIVKMIVPNGSEAKGKTQEDFLINRLKPTDSDLFHLINHQTPQVKTTLSAVRLEPIFRPLSDPLEPWQHRFKEKLPVLVINTEGEELRDALDEQDWLRVKFLLAVYTAGALCDGFIEGPQHLVLLYQSRLAARIQTHYGRDFDSNLKRLAERVKETRV